MAHIVSRPQTPKSRNFLRYNFVTISYDSGVNEVLFVKIGAWVLDLWLDTFSGPKWPKCSLLTQIPKPRPFLRYHNFAGFIFWFQKKWGPVCENWSQGSGLMIGYIFWAQMTQNGDSRPQIPKSKTFLRYHNFVGFIFWFWKKWVPVCENWGQGQGSF